MQLQLSARLNHALGAVGVALAGKLDDDFVVSLAVGSDQGFGQAQGIDAAPDRFFGLVHRLLLKVDDAGLLHRHEIAGGFARSGRNIPIGELIIDEVAGGAGLLGGNIVNQNLGVVSLRISS